MKTKILSKKYVFISLLGFMVFVLTAAIGSFAFEVTKSDMGAEIKWQNPSETLLINPAGGPAGSLSSILAGMQTWTDVPTASFVFLYGGTTAKNVTRKEMIILTTTGLM